MIEKRGYAKSTANTGDQQSDNRISKGAFSMKNPLGLITSSYEREINVQDRRITNIQAVISDFAHYQVQKGPVIRVQLRNLNKGKVSSFNIVMP